MEGEHLSQELYSLLEHLRVFPSLKGMLSPSRKQAREHELKGLVLWLHLLVFHRWKETLSPRLKPLVLLLVPLQDSLNWNRMRGRRHKPEDPVARYQELLRAVA